MHKRKKSTEKKDAEEFLTLLQEDLPTFVNRPAMETKIKTNTEKKKGLAYHTRCFNI